MANVEIKDSEVEFAENEALDTTGMYVHTLKKPFEYEGKKYETLTFDFEALTGSDSLAIETELQLLNRPVVVREISGEYQIRVAARACQEHISVDALKALPIKECTKILNRTRSFLLSAE